VSPSARATAVLSRFPRHLDADAPAKRFTVVADAPAQELDVKTSQLGRIRRAHALGDAGQERDLLLLAGLHGFRAQDFDLLGRRLAAVRTLGRTLADDAAADDAVAAALERLPAVLGVEAEDVPPFPGEPDSAAARARLAGALEALAGYDSELDQLRATVRAAIALHRRGNGTVAALLGAAATYLALEVEDVVGEPERFWHLARCRDRLRLVRPEQPGAARPSSTGIEPERDLLALEENPFQAKEIDPILRRHGDRFRVVRGGLEPVTVAVRVLGIGDRTVAPMVVNVDTGVGLAYVGHVPDGQELRFESDGRVTLAGGSVAAYAFSFLGGVFADEDALAPGRDFVFADESAPEETGDRTAEFAVTRPVGNAFEVGSTPHAEALLDVQTLALGESRWAFFVQVAHFGAGSGADARFAVPAFSAGIFDESVYASDAGPAEPAGAVGFAWQEREPFALTVWVPRRFSNLDAEGELPVTERLRALLDAHRAAGVHVYVRYADDRWTIGTGVVRELDATDPRGLVVAGTTLWPEETAQPTPD
jgi:hypothetical protein